MKEIQKMPPWHNAALPATNIIRIFTPKKLHTHHSKNEDDDGENKGQIRKGPQCVCHNCKNIVERLPGLRQFENPE